MLSPAGPRSLDEQREAGVHPSQAKVKVVITPEKIGGLDESVETTRPAATDQLQLSPEGAAAKSLLLESEGGADTAAGDAAALWGDDPPAAAAVDKSVEVGAAEPDDDSALLANFVGGGPAETLDDSALMAKFGLGGLGEDEDASFPPRQPDR